MLTCRCLGRWSALAIATVLAACSGALDVDRKGPRVVSTSPARNATGVAQNATISATFSKPIDLATATASTFFVTDGGGIPIWGTVTADGPTITFTPSRALEPRITHTAHVFRAISDRSGNPMSANFTWTFSTVAHAPPEHVSSRIQVGTAVTEERIESAGDVDDFHLRVAAGAEWVVFARSGPNELSSIKLTVHDSLTDALIGEVITHSRSTEIEDRSTGRFVVPGAGAYVVRVTGDAEATYAFRVDAVNRAPEMASTNYTIGDTIAESIGSVGDIDEFTFQGIAGQEVAIALQLLAAMPGTLTMELHFGGSRIAVIEAQTSAPGLDDFGMSRMILENTGTYLLRFLSAPQGSNAASTGAYRFNVYKVDRRPENGVQLQIDAPPIASAIDRPADIDEYELTGTAGQLVVLRLTSTGTRRGDLTARLTGTDGTRYATVQTGQTTDGGSLEYSRRVQLPHTGTYRLVVQGIPDWGLAHGPYALEAYTVSAAPEHVPASIALGQSVTAERIDRPGDIDVFTFAGEAGREVNVFLGWAETNAELYAWVAFNIFTRPGTLALDGQSTGRFAVKDSTYTVTVDPQSAAQNHMMHSQGAYALRVFPIDPRPESRLSAYAFGDTVSAEPLYPAGDVDDYTFELTEPTEVEIFWEALPAANLVWGYLIGDRVPDTAVWFGSVTSTGPQVQRITLPADRYRLSVFSPNAQPGGDVFRPKAPTLSYRFAISRPATP